MKFTGKNLAKIFSEANDEDQPIEIVTATTVPFSFTLRKTTNGDRSDQKDYRTKLEKFRAMGIQITDSVFENNTINNGIHCHGVMQIPKKFNMKRFRTRGWHIKLDEIFNYDGWLEYMTKQNSLYVPDEKELEDRDTWREEHEEEISEEIEPQITIPKVRLFI